MMRASACGSTDASAGMFARDTGEGRHATPRAVRCVPATYQTSSSSTTHKPQVGGVTGACNACRLVEPEGVREGARSRPALARPWCSLPLEAHVPAAHSHVSTRASYTLLNVSSCYRSVSLTNTF